MRECGGVDLELNIAPGRRPSRPRLELRFDFFDIAVIVKGVLDLHCVVFVFVEGFVGRDRGYRALSFMPASALELSSVKVVRDVETAGSGDGPVLLVDGDAAPQGWIDPARGPHPLRVGALFDPRADTLRVALDSALTSPVGLAVAVDRETGRYVGVVSADGAVTKLLEPSEVLPSYSLAARVPCPSRFIICV